jgi:hypothetical protein
MTVDDGFVYLAYGSNLHPARLEARVGPVDCLGALALPGWMLRFDKRGADGSSKANLRAAPGSDETAWAVAYRLHRSQYRTLDRFEGCGSGYESFFIRISIGDRNHDALAYLAPSHWIANAMRPFDWYLRLVMEGARFHEFPAGYIERIESTPSIEDHDAERARRHLSQIE